MEEESRERETKCVEIDGEAAIGGGVGDLVVADSMRRRKCGRYK